MQKRGFTLVELIAVIVVLGIIIMLAISTFKNVGDRVKKEAYENKINLIKTKASEYASGTKILVTNVDRLVKKGYMSADNENGDVINPIDGSRMNCKIVTMYKSEGNYYADYVEDESKEECDASQIKYDNGYTSIDKYLLNSEELIETSEWTREDNLLILRVNDPEMVPIADIEKIKWETNTSAQEKKGEGEEKFKFVVNNSIVDTTVTATLYLKPKVSENEESEESKSERTFTSTTWVKIDKKRPWVDQKVEIDRPNEWTNYGKEVRITAGDEGSGVGAYAVIEEEEWNNLAGNNKCENASYEEKEGNAYTTRLENGKYYVCVKDKAGNVSEDMKEPLFEIDKADATPPKCEIHLPEPKGKDGWYTEDILFEFLEDADGIESIKGSGIDTSQIFVDGKLYNETSYVLEEDRDSFVVSMNVTDKAGNVCHQEVEVKRDATAPTCEYSGESTTWTNNNRTISLGCDDNLSGCAMSYKWSKTYSSTVAEAEFGSYTIEDRAGNTTVCSRYVEAYVDKNAPDCKIDVSGTKGANGWYTSDVTFKFSDGATYEDANESGVKTKTIKVNGVEQTSDSYVLNYDTSSFKATISVTDNAGNTCSKEATVKRDATRPSCSYSGESTSWIRENRTIGLTCQDNLSGCAMSYNWSKIYSWTVKIANDFGSYTITDRAGNSNTCNRSVNVYVDKCDSSEAVESDWGSCSENCGGGTKKKTIYYRSTTGSGFKCDAKGRPTSKSTECNTQACSSGGGGGGGSCTYGYGCCTDDGNCQCKCAPTGNDYNCCK